MKHRERQPWGLEYSFELYDPNGNLIEITPKFHNMIPQAGVDQLAGLFRGTASLISNYYLGLYEGNYLPNDPSVKAADLPTSVHECVSYQSATRPEWIDDYDNVSTVSNDGNRAEFVFTAQKRIYGGFLISSPTKGGNTGLLMSIARFPSPRDVEVGSTLRLLAGVVFVPTTVS